MSESNARKAHPKGLYILFATEMWERFNYYGMRALLILFMTKALLFNKEFSSNLYGSYISLLYLSALFGGFVADRYWGNRRSIIAGGLVMALGELILFFCGNLYHSAPGLSTFLFYSGLGLMIAGNGFFKPNISSLVGQLYPDTDTRKDAAYTIFYMGINTGGALGPFLCGLFGDTGNPADFKWGFLVAGIGMLLSVIVQVIFHRKYVVDPDKKVLGLVPANAPKWVLSPVVTLIGLAILSCIGIGLIYIDAAVFSYLFYLLIACIVLIPAVIYADKSLNKIEKDKVLVICIVCFFVIFFWSAFEQAGASLTFFAEEQTNRVVNFSMAVWKVYILSAAILLALAALVKKAMKNLPVATDGALRGVVLFLLIGTIVVIAGANIYLYTQHIPSITKDVIPASWFQSLNSLFVVCFAPFFAWMWLKLGKTQPSSPTKMAIGLLGLGMGFWWIAFGSGKALPGVKVSMIWLTGMYALHTCGELCLSPIGLSLVNRLSPLKYSSLLMAIWFTANAFGNKMAGVLSALYPDGKEKVLLGYHITDLHSFFMVFVVMSLVASGILFLLTKKLQKMMHEGKAEAVVLPEPDHVL